VLRTFVGARLLIVESVGLSESVDKVRYELQSQFADAVAEEVRHAIPHDRFYADKDHRCSDARWSAR